MVSHDTRVGLRPTWWCLPVKPTSTTCKRSQTFTAIFKFWINLLVYLYFKFQHMQNFCQILGGFRLSTAAGLIESDTAEVYMEDVQSQSILSTRGGRRLTIVSNPYWCRYGSSPPEPERKTNRTFNDWSQFEYEMTRFYCVQSDDMWQCSLVNFNFQNEGNI